MKRPYLSVYDYGMGGIWAYIDAPSVTAITDKYPELQVFEEPPDFLQRDDLDRIAAESHFDIDAAPTGLLADLVAQRPKP